jgi:hypothetical protein
MFPTGRCRRHGWHRDVAGAIGNLVATESFTVVMLTATLADPVLGNSTDADLLNNRGYFDVDFLAIPLPAGTTGIDLASITDLDPEFTRRLCLRARRYHRARQQPGAGPHRRHRC